MNKSGKIANIVLWGLLIISAILIVFLMINNNEENETDPAMLSWVNTNLVWSYILGIVGAGVAVIAGLVKMFTDKKAAKSGIVSILFLGIVVLIAYLLASPEIPSGQWAQKFINDGTLTSSVAKMVDTGLIATYIFLGLAIIAVASSSVTRFLK